MKYIKDIISLKGDFLEVIVKRRSLKAYKDWDLSKDSNEDL